MLSFFIKIAGAGLKSELAEKILAEKAQPNRYQPNGPGSGIQGSWSGVQSPVVWDRGPRVQGPSLRSGVWGPGSKGRGLGSGVRALGTRVRGPRSEYQGPGSGIRGLGSRVRGASDFLIIFDYFFDYFLIRSEIKKIYKNK